MTVNHYPAGTLVRARDRDWLVLPGAPHGLLLARPLGGRDEETTVLLPEFDDPRPAVFTAPTVDDRGDANRARLLRDALRLSFRATGGPFRCFANLSVTPRNYQLVPLMMSAAQDTTRLLIADGVGVGKTVEAGLIAAELLATGDAHRLAVLCSPQLAPQWQAELRNKFGIDAQLLLPSTVNRLKSAVGINDLPALPAPGDLHRLHQATHPPRRIRPALPRTGDRRRSPHLRGPGQRRRNHPGAPALHRCCAGSPTTPTATCCC